MASTGAQHDDDLALEVPAVEGDVAGDGADGDRHEELRVPEIAGDALDDRVADDLPLEPQLGVTDAVGALDDDAVGLALGDANVHDGLDLADTAPSFVGVEHEGFGHDTDERDHEEFERDGLDDGGLEGLNDAESHVAEVELPAIDGEDDESADELDIGVGLDELPVGLDELPVAPCG
ncbi:MAG: hypothetical protein EXR75_03880 [Myxococcales bacterium]|nr:hypothetical protein [Myxococcales bacterium]